MQPHRDGLGDVLQHFDVLPRLRRSPDGLDGARRRVSPGLLVAHALLAPLPRGLDAHGGAQLRLPLPLLVHAPAGEPAVHLLDGGGRQVLHQHAVGLAHAAPAVPGLEPQHRLRADHVLDELARMSEDGQVVPEVVPEGQARLGVHKLHPRVRHKAGVEQMEVGHGVERRLHVLQLEPLLIDQLEKVTVKWVLLRSLLCDLAHKVHLAVVVFVLLPFRGQRRVHCSLGYGHEVHFLPRGDAEVLGHLAALLRGRGVVQRLLLQQLVALLAHEHEAAVIHLQRMSPLGGAGARVVVVRLALVVAVPLPSIWQI
mmetsp:Transcript_45919/g.87654  ORF Transcript_45919/g.87654 Transcript_45919/m.87654 type:complete len:312 (-) Transcript_45919:625-1560(-)